MSERSPINIAQRLAQLQRHDVYDKISKMGRQTFYLDGILEWADEACKLLVDIRYAPVNLPDDGSKVSALFMQIDEIVSRLTKIANYCFKLKVARYRSLDAILAEAYWHSLGPGCNLALANHHFGRSESDPQMASPEELSEGDYMGELILAERYLDGIGVDRDIDEAEALYVSVCKDHDDETLGAEGRRIKARFLATDDVELGKSELKDLWDEGYLSSLPHLLALSQREPESPASEDEPSSGKSDAGDELIEPAVIPSTEPSIEEQLNIELESLNNMIGLASVKTQVRQLISYEQIEGVLRERGLTAAAGASRHMVLTGNPGTGKTTVARKLARLFYLIGVLKKDLCVETKRNDLVGGYEGQTAIKTAEVIQSALDGVLFIDEAYSLSDDDGSFGSEAINTLLAEMENHRANLIVIVAGYTAQMEEFLESNPGLRSRFKETLHFDDYDVADMAAIYAGMSRTAGYVLDQRAAGVAAFVFQELQGTKVGAGNGRFVRTFYEKCIDHHHERLATVRESGKPISDAIYKTIEASDVAFAAGDFGVDVSSVRAHGAITQLCGVTETDGLHAINAIGLIHYQLEKLK